MSSGYTCWALCGSVTVRHGCRTCVHVVKRCFLATCFETYTSSVGRDFAGPWLIHGGIEAWLFVRGVRMQQVKDHLKNSVRQNQDAERVLRDKVSIT